MRISMMMVTLGIVFGAMGCSPSSDLASKDAAKPNAKYALVAELAGAMPVGEARKTAKTDEAITLVGLIVGSSAPFVDGMAAFTIVDAKVPYCAADESCPTPWDYCCQTDAVKDNIATVQIVDESGKLVLSDARKLLNVKELSTVTVRGRILRLLASRGTRLTGLETSAGQNTSTVAQIYDPSQLQIRADIRLEDVPKIHNGQPVEMRTASATELIRGTVLQSTSSANV